MSSNTRQSVCMRILLFPTPSRGKQITGQRPQINLWIWSKYDARFVQGKTFQTTVEKQVHALVMQGCLSGR